MDIKNLDRISLPDGFEDQVQKTYRAQKKKSRRAPYLRPLAAACALVLLVGMAVPAYTRDLPVYSNLFTLLGMEKYQESSDLVLTTKEDQGIKITLSDIILSNNVLSYTYILESDQDLGPDLNIVADMSPAAAMKYKVLGASGSSKLEQIDDTTYLGVHEIWLTFKDGQAPDQMDFTLQFQGLQALDSSGPEPIVTDIKGKWNFPVSVQKLPNTVTKPSFVYEDSGIFMKIHGLHQDQAVTNLDLQVWTSYDFSMMAYQVQDIRLTDQDGKTYPLEGGGGSADKNMASLFYQSPALEKGKAYELEVDLVKDGTLGTDAQGQVSYVAGYGTADYEAAPETVHAVIPFRIEA